MGHRAVSLAHKMCDEKMRKRALKSLKPINVPPLKKKKNNSALSNIHAKTKIYEKKKEEKEGTTKSIKGRVDR